MRNLLLCAVMLCAGCATSDPGWHGEGAMPFDRAETECETQAGGDAARFEACMARKGWHRDVDG